MSIRNIIFDMGNVVCDYNAARIVEELPIDPANKEAVLSELFRSPQWILMDAGFYSEEEVMEAIRPRLLAYPGANERVLEDAQFALDHWFEHFPPIPETLEIVKALKEAGYRIYLLSNANSRFPQYQDRVEAFSYMDGLFVSCFYHCMKPEPEIYETMLKTFGLTAEECVFIDDNATNVAGGIICGIKGIVYQQDPEALKMELINLGIKADFR